MRGMDENQRTASRPAHDLTPAIDLTLHHGSIDQSFLDEINKYYCTPEGWNYLRDVYLKQNLTPQGSTVISPGFVQASPIARLAGGIAAFAACPTLAARDRAGPDLRSQC